MARRLKGVPAWRVAQRFQFSIPHLIEQRMPQFASPGEAAPHGRSGLVAKVALKVNVVLAVTRLRHGFRDHFTFLDDGAYVGGQRSQIDWYSPPRRKPIRVMAQKFVERFHGYSILNVSGARFPGRGSACRSP